MKYILLSSIFSRWLRHREVKCPRSHYYMSDPGFEPRISGSRVCSLNYTKQYPHWSSYGVSPLWITQDQTLFPEGKKGKTVLYQLSVIAQPPTLTISVYKEYVHAPLSSRLLVFLVVTAPRRHTFYLLHGKPQTK